MLEGLVEFVVTKASEGSLAASDVAMKVANDWYWVVVPRANDCPLVWKTVSESTRAVLRFC